MSFEFTPKKQTLSNQLWAITSAVGAGLCFLVLVLAGFVWLHQPSRHHLDRVSFRIVMYALLGNTFFGIASAVGGQLKGPGFGCGFSIFVLQLTLEFSSFMLFSIALNLQLVVVHGVNGRRMEKFYIVGSALMAVILTVPAYAAGQYGWDPLEKDCWYTNDDKAQRLAWQLGTQMIWTGLTVLGEVMTSLTVMVFMIRHHFRQKQIFTTSQQSSSTNSQSRSQGGGIAPANAPQVIHANNYRSVIVRIALYPLASMLVNALSIMTALHSTISSGINTQNDYNILLLSDFLYGGRAVVYALLAASDPALIRGLRSLLTDTFPSFFGQNSRFGSQYSNTSISFAGVGKSSSRNRGQASTFGGRSGGGVDGMVVTIELETVREPDYAITADVGAKDDTKDRREGSRDRDKIEHEDVASETKIRDLEEGDMGLGFGVESDSEPYMTGAPTRPPPPSRTTTLDGTLSPHGRPSTGDTVRIGRTASQREGDVGGAEGRRRQRRSWDVSMSMVRRRQREALRKEQEDAFGRQL